MAESASIYGTSPGPRESVEPSGYMSINRTLAAQSLSGFVLRISRKQSRNDEGELLE